MCKRRLKALYRVVEDGFQIIPILHIKPVLSGRLGQIYYLHANTYAHILHTHTTQYMHIQIHCLLLKVHQARAVLARRSSASHFHPPPVSLPSTPTSPRPPPTTAGKKRYTHASVCEVQQFSNWFKNYIPLVHHGFYIVSSPPQLMLYILIHK